MALDDQPDTAALVLLSGHYVPGLHPDVPLVIWGELTVPVVIMAGDGGRVGDFETQPGQLHRDVPGSELQRIAGAGHMVHHIAPGQVAAAIEQAASAAAG